MDMGKMGVVGINGDSLVVGCFQVSLFLLQTQIIISPTSRRLAQMKFLDADVQGNARIRPTKHLSQTIRYTILRPRDPTPNSNLGIRNTINK
jgi:hypothetical protein